MAPCKHHGLLEAAVAQAGHTSVDLYCPYMWGASAGAVSAPCKP